MTYVFPLNNNFVNVQFFDSSYTKASEIPTFCVEIAQILNRQPLCNVKGSISEKTKGIALKNWSDVRICDIFNTNAWKWLGKPNWSICGFGNGNDQRQDVSDNDLPQGMELSLYENVSNCPAESLQKMYDAILNTMRTGWMQRSEKDPKYSEEYRLFVKEVALVEEDALIRFMASRFSMKEDIECDVGPQRSEDCNKIYLRVKKSALEKVIAQFGFKIKDRVKDEF